MAHPIFSAVFLVWATLVAASDIRSRRISNGLVLAGLASGFASAFFDAGPFGISLPQALVGMLIGLVGLFPFFLLRAMGAADVKVFAVLGAWCGAHSLLGLWVIASLVAGLHAVVLMLLSRTSPGVLWHRREPTLALGRYRATPYAACLVATAVAWLAYFVAAGGMQ
ncbi:prepilin peptidase [Burkholderia ambifaria]|uniref:Peptidase A24A prepilin type IV n=1 Tax=Burkholderia ambifaria MEX-5 TaxID=396597 RepID=B1T1K1_9BURK|nr:prepilin peptidase [Burkholderia ambifaria]EDT42571.1 peptidase A24A prepilin type IV [Burkholderia ambifaria MEX-5]